jgi:prefoldin subunit 5
MTYDELEKALDFVSEEKQKLMKENELLKEELTNLKNDITRVYNTMISLETINKHELEEIEEL